MQKQYTIRKIGPEALDELLLIQEEALRQLPSPDWLRENSKEALAECLLPPHSAIAAFDLGNRMAGFAILYVPDQGSENIALSAGYAEEDAAETANLKLVIVRPAHQGHGLQRKMMNILEEQARERGFRSLWATVSPHNTFSRRNIIACGYDFVAQQEKYGGLLRDLFTKTLCSPTPMGSNTIKQNNKNTNIDMERKVRVRFAPSPTGALHIGGVRTALYNYLFARQHGGDMLLRIEDTDSTRFVPGAEEYIIEALQWLGIGIDEGIGVKPAADSTRAWEQPKEGLPCQAGENGPYRQSERREIYHQYVDQLLKSGHAYIAFDTPAELEAKRNEIQNFQYDARTREQMVNSLTLSKEEVEARIAKGDQYVVRFKVEPNEDVHVHDLIRGEVVINSNILDDKVLYKSADDLPTYHLANIVDDHLMAVSHVIRGEEWLPSAPLHVLLYRAFGWKDTMPEFAHLPLLLKPDGNGKLSKRDGDRLGFPVFPLEFHNQKDGSVSSGYRESGYMPEAVINFLALLGWHATGDQEMFTMEELIEQFSLDRVSKAGAKFDYEKGKWFNHQYLQQKSGEELYDAFLASVPAEHKTAVEAKGKAVVAHVIDLMKERVNFINELWAQAAFFFVAPEAYDEKSLKKRWKEESPEHMRELYKVLEGIETWETETEDANESTINKTVMGWIAEKELGVGLVMNAFRITLVGEARGPHIWDITNVLGKEETLRRLATAIEKLG